MPTLVLVGVAVAAVVLIGLCYGIVRSRQGSSLASRLQQVPPVRGRVIASEVEESNFYIHSGGSDHGPVSPVGRRHFRRRVETIEYPGPDGRMLRGRPALSESNLPDRTGTDVRVHLDPDDPEVFIAPVGERLGLASTYAWIWGPVALCVVAAVIFVCVFGILFGFGGPPEPGV